MQKAIAKEELYKAAERALVTAVAQVGQHVRLQHSCTCVPAAQTCQQAEKGNFIVLLCYGDHCILGGICDLTRTHPDVQASAGRRCCSFQKTSRS